MRVENINTIPKRTSADKKTSGSKLIKDIAFVGTTFSIIDTFNAVPEEKKAAIYAKVIGEKSYVKKAIKAAEKTGKRLGKTFDMQQMSEKAKDLYSELAPQAGKAAKDMIKHFGKTMAAFTGGVLIASLIVNKIAEKKAEQQTK